MNTFLHQGTNEQRCALLLELVYSLRDLVKTKNEFTATNFGQFCAVFVKISTHLSRQSVDEYTLELFEQFFEKFLRL